MNRIIENTSQLSDFCIQLLNDKPQFIAADTEFISNKHHRYLPKLCLIQICYHDIAVIIDVLSDNIDLEQLKEIFFHPDIKKVFHDFKHDVLTLLPLLKYIPFPIMDTQMMARLCNYNQANISYAELAMQLLDVSLNKDYTRTDWTKRPLSEQQIDYALFDVIYLTDIYEKLLEELTSRNRLAWIQEDIKKITSSLLIPYSTKNDPSIIVRQILCQCRRDKKLLKDINDLQIYQLSYAKKYTAKLFSRFISTEEINKLLLATDRPEKIVKDSNSKSLECLAQLMLDQYSLNNQIAYQALASNAELSRLIAGDYLNIRLLSGWRYQEIGERLQDMLTGKLEMNIKITNNNIELKLSEK